jgi:hypothetical protein
LERTNKIHYFLEHLVVILQRYYKILGSTIKLNELLCTALVRMVSKKRLSREQNIEVTLHTSSGTSSGSRLSIASDASASHFSILSILASRYVCYAPSCQISHRSIFPCLLSAMDLDRLSCLGS